MSKGGAGTLGPGTLAGGRAFHVWEEVWTWVPWAVRTQSRNSGQMVTAWRS